MRDEPVITDRPVSDPIENPFLRLAKEMITAALKHIVCTCPKCGTKFKQELK